MKLINRCWKKKSPELFRNNSFLKRGQIWYTDFMFGILIFSVVVIVYFTFAHSYEQDDADVLSDLVMDAKSISSTIVQAGSPSDWNETSVTVIGLTDGNQRIVPEKLSMFANMSYGESKTKLRTSYDYYIYFEDINGSRIFVDEKEGIGKELNNTDNVVALTRILIYDSRLISMVVKVWQ